MTFAGNKPRVIHASLAPVPSLLPAGVGVEEVERLAPQVLAVFFGPTPFARVPDDPRHPRVKHYFAVLS